MTNELAICGMTADDGLVSRGSNGLGGDLDVTPRMFYVPGFHLSSALFRLNERHTTD
jgi:hypothetical protein